MFSLRRRLAALSCAVLGAVALVAVQPVSAATRPVSGAFVTGYAIARPVCDAVPRPGRFTCMAFERVDVSKGTPGARRYTMPTAFRGPGGGYTPAALAKAYNFDARSGGKRQTVAVVDWYNDPSVRSDLNHFDRHYGFPVETSKSFRVVNQNGKAKPLPQKDAEASVEISLDVETVRSVCRNCRIILLEGNAGNAADLAVAENTAVRMGATVISNSFGSPERKNHPYPASIRKAFEHPGVVITASSGDNGYFYWDLRNGDPFNVGGLPHTASFPASLADIVSVGGTALRLNADGTRKSESVWDSDGDADSVGNDRDQAMGAAGGGCSVLYATPSWQKHLGGYRAAGCGGKRLSVDVAALADPATGFSVYDSYGLGGWAPIGGTSLSSPIIAGMYALAGGANGQSRPVHSLYENFRLRKGALNDVTTGGNGWCGGVATDVCSTESNNRLGTNNPNDYYFANVDCSYPLRGQVKNPPKKSTECNAGSGFDGPTGVGTPHGLHGFHPTTPTVSISASSPRQPHHRIVFTGHVTRALKSTTITRKRWYFGDHTGPVTSSAKSVGHRFAKKGSYTVTLKVSDSAGQQTSGSRRLVVK